ncbi:MAG: argininosuccinate synthase [Pantoea sp. Brub]|nr:argininosuccinate synthase [Pantoea sp. Brub]
MPQKKINKIVLAYSGGLDTSVIIPWLKENYNQCDIVAFVADIGQEPNSLQDLHDKALQSGASSFHLFDLKEEFIKEYVYPVLQTGAIYEGGYLMGTAMSRPIIAKYQVELAMKIGADALCHGATGKGNDQVRFETAYAALAPNLKCIAPWREWQFCSRENLIEYLKKNHITSNISEKKIYSRDENAWHISTEGGILEDPINKPNKDCWIWTVDPIEAPNKPEDVIVSIHEGKINAINHKVLSPFQCLNKLNILGAKHGIGRLDIIENRLVGIKSRGCYETPGGTIMMTALRALEQLVLDRDSLKWRLQLGHEFSYIVYDGRWFTPVRKSIQASAESLSKYLTGEIVLTLYKGQVIAIQKQSINSLYSKTYSTFGKDKIYNHHDANGFIHLYSLSSRIRALKKQNQLI